MTVGPVDSPLPNETLQQTAQRMTIAFNGLCKEFEANTKELREQKKYGRHTRFGLWVALVSLLVDLPLTALLLVSYNNSQDAVRTANAVAAEAAHTAQEDLYTNCLKGNTSRQEQISLFDDILVAVAPTIGPTETTKFSNLIKTTFALRNCNDLKPKVKPPSDAAVVFGSVAQSGGDRGRGQYYFGWSVPTVGPGGPISFWSSVSEVSNGAAS
jgi:hypothetical protein